MLTYLDANLHPEKYAAGATPGSSAATLREALALDHESRADMPGGKIVLAWWINLKPLYLDHDGGTFGYTSFARFNPVQDWAVIVLYNRSPLNPASLTDPSYTDSVGERHSLAVR
jgi:hypothetical protein